jgi:uncharacterized repeat protein (TIGR01451 family)
MLPSLVESVAMVQTLRRWVLVLLTAGLAGAGGCSGVGQGPYFPSLMPNDGGARTDAKTPWPSIFPEAGPRPVKVEVVPVDATNPVRTQHVLVATVLDENGRPCPRRRVEWMLEGVGNLIEVDDSGGSADRGTKRDNHYAVSFTAEGERRISRNNGNPNDDFVLRPGQTWCAVTSAVEGDSHVTVYGPEVANWDNHKVFVTAHWVDADWVFPRPAVNRAGTQHVFTTSILKHTDRQPLAGYHVRYKILDGPPAVFLPERKREAEVAADSAGNASVTLGQVAPEIGVNRIGVEVLRPPDGPSGSYIVIGKGETSKEWQAPQVTLSTNGPVAIGVGAEVPYTILVSNNGKVDSEFLTVHDVIPQGFKYLRSEPGATREGNEWVWPVGKLPGGESRSMRIVFQSTQPGRVVNSTAVVSLGGTMDKKDAVTEVVLAGLKAALTAPAQGVVGAPITYDITVTNTGTGPATNVVLRDDFDEGLEHESKARPLELAVGTLEAQASKTVRITLTPRRAGRPVNRVTAAAEGVQPASAEQAVVVQEAKLSLKQTGPRFNYVGRPVEWKLTVGNPGEMAVNNVAVRDRLPAEVAFQGASEGGVFDNGVVTWNLGTLQPREQRTVTVTAKGARLSPQAVNLAVATADPGVEVRDEGKLEVRGLPAFRLGVYDLDDPVELNAKTTYKVEVTNQGTLPGSRVQVTAFVPPQMKVLSSNGPTVARTEGQQVTFPPVDALQPGQTVTYLIEVQALQTGDVRFKAELRADTLSAPVIKEESTNIYAAPAAPAASPPAAVPAAPSPRPAPAPMPAPLPAPPEPTAPATVLPAPTPPPATPASPPAAVPPPPATPTPAVAPPVPPPAATAPPASPPAAVSPPPVTATLPAAPPVPPPVPAPTSAGPPRPAAVPPPPAPPTPMLDPPPLPAAGGIAAPPPPLPVPGATGAKPPG